jgi:hypothetical protein
MTMQYRELGLPSGTALDKPYLAVGPGELDSRQYRPVSSEYAFRRANRHEYLSGMTGC